jgi:ribokinase
VPVLPRPGETVGGGEFARHDGGKGANQAVAAARLGAPVVFVGAVGDDDLGPAALASLRAEGIDARAVVVAGVPTGIAQICVDDRGENQIAVASGANAELTAARVDSALAGWEPDAGVYLANLEISDEAVLAGAAFADRHGMRIVINTAPARPLPAELLSLAPVLLSNAGEATDLTGKIEPAEAGRALSRLSGRQVVVTLGRDGALVVDGETTLRAAAPAVEAVDSTGAGDTFAGALAAEMASGATLDDAVRVAVSAAALSVARPGARGGMPTRDEVEVALNALPR